jgi:1,4-alpha-glucan branching enzyme
LERARAGGLWTVTIPLTPGRHRYAFIVDGRRWVPDPGAPRAAGDDFDTPSSVVTVGGDL